MKIFFKKSLVDIILTSLLLMFPKASHAQTKAWEGTIMIPTYEVKADVNPKFWIMEEAPFGAVTIKNSITYPYTMQDDISNTKVNRIYKALFLENEYLKITCLPELNGKFYSVIDKTVGKEMFWVNHVIKPSLIAMRGAGIIGGKVFNPGPQVHTTTMVSTIDAIIGHNDDGSVYLEVGNIEQMFRTRWTARVTLHPGKAYLDETVRIFNPTDEIHPYYFWNNASLQNTPGKRFIFPMSMATFHDGKEFFTWPIFTGEDTQWLKGVQGRDMSLLKNYDTWAPIFAYKCAFDFFGAYDVDDDHGIVHVADRVALSGKKAWTWGNWEYGIESQKTFTDQDGTYIEIQSGPLSTQSDFGMLGPREEISWREWWYPVHDLDQGFEYATKDIAIETIHNESNVEIRLLATGVFPEAMFTVTNDKATLLKENVNLSPEKIHKFEISKVQGSSLNITIKTKEGNVLASFVTPLQIPKVSSPNNPKNLEKPDEELTVEEKYLMGQRFDLEIDRKQATEYYKKALEEDPSHLASLRALAVLDIEAGLFQEAILKLQNASTRDKSDGLTWYFMGIAYLKLGNYSEATLCATRSIQCFGTSSLGFDLAGRAYMGENEYIKAVEAFNEAIKLNPSDQQGHNHFILALYAFGETDKAKQMAKEIISLYPTDLTPRSLIAIQSETEMDRFVKEINSFTGDMDFEVIETSLIFLEMGLLREASMLLSAACIEAIPETKQNPLAVYYLAYLAFLQNDLNGSKAYLNHAAKIYKDFVFASRPEELPILNFAVLENPKDANAHLHLGNLYGDLGRLDEAVTEWRKAIELNSSLSMAFRNLGLFEWKIQNNLENAEFFYEKAIAARQDDQTLYRDLAQILITDLKRAEAIALLESIPPTVRKRSDIVLLLVEAYIGEQKYSQAINLLGSTLFIPWEGQITPWNLFNRAYVKRGIQYFENKKFNAALKDFNKALTYPENLHVGRFTGAEEASAYYWMGKTFKTLGRDDKARQAWLKGSDGQEGSKEQNEYLDLCKESLR